MQKEENDTLITDNKTLTHQRIIDRLNRLGALGRSPSSSPSIIRTVLKTTAIAISKGIDAKEKTT
jgi:hypothetical protein